MISRLCGEVLEVELDQAVIGVGGVGLTVHTTPTVLAELARGQQADLATVLLVREDSLTLYGFTDPPPASCSWRCRPSPASARGSR